MNENKKHSTPLWCRLRRAVVSPSPSAYAWCLLGLRKRTRQCKGCKNNQGELMVEAFQAGLEAGAKQGLTIKLSNIDENHTKEAADESHA